MHIHVDDDCLRRILPDATDIAVSDVEVIAQLAFLTAEIDLDEDVDEGRLLDVLNRNLWRIVDATPRPIIPISPLPIDREERTAWLRELVPQLTTRDARELAYVAAYLTVVIDLELAPVESELLSDLQRALRIDDQRTAELGEAASEVLTALDHERAPDEEIARAPTTA